MSGRVRVISFNTAKGDGAYRRRITAAGHALAALDPDIVLVQEALLSADGRYDTARDLANALGFAYASVAVRNKRRMVEGATVWSWSSPAILARWPIAAIQPVPLPSDPADGERLALGARIAAPFGVISVVNAHLTHLPLSELRRRQLASIFESPCFTETAELRLLGGDLNAPPNAPEVAALLEGQLGWEATDAVAPGDDAGGTLVDFATGQRRGPRVDHLIVLRTPSDPLVSVLASRIVLDGRHQDVTLSDHLAVLADLAVGSQAERSALV